MAPDDAVVNETESLREEIERKVGRNLLRYQRIEHLMKHLVGANNVAGSPDDLLSRRDHKISTVDKNTMGQVAQQFTQEVVVPDSRPVDDAPFGLIGFWVSMNYNIVLGDDRHASMVEDLRTAVGKRNDLVHHFLKRFDTFTDEGAREAVQYLDQEYADTTPLWQRLEDVADHVREGRELIAALLNSKQYQDYIEFHWGHGQRVSRLLSEYAAEKGDEDGWADLSKAANIIAKEAPEEMAALKARYGNHSLKEILLGVAWYEVCEEPTPKGGVRTLYRTQSTWARQDDPVD